MTDGVYGNDAAFAMAEAWINSEHKQYQVEKTPAATDDLRTAQEPEAWDGIIDMYLHRARTLGLDNPLGRQAVAKAAATAVGYLESIIRLYGNVPGPGVSSGDLSKDPWTLKS